MTGGNCEKIHSSVGCTESHNIKLFVKTRNKRKSGRMCSKRKIEFGIVIRSAIATKKRENKLERNRSIFPSFKYVVITIFVDLSLLY